MTFGNERTRISRLRHFCSRITEKRRAPESSDLAIFQRFITQLTRNLV